MMMGVMMMMKTVRIMIMMMVMDGDAGVDELVPVTD
jgi:hypothetical protein